MQKQLVLTILADDQPGIVEQLASVIINHKGNWTQSSMSRLGEKFAGILLEFAQFCDLTELGAEFS